MKVLLAGGGTGGHINPALAIASIIKKHDPSAEFLFVGTPNGMEARLVPAAGYPMETMHVAGFQRKLTLKNIENKILKEVDCGLTAESGDFKTLAENVIAMYRKTEEERLQLGMNGQTYYKVHFQKKVCIDKLDQTMKI